MAYGSRAYGGGEGAFQRSLLVRSASDTIITTDALATRVPIQPRNGEDAAFTRQEPQFPRLVQRPVSPVFSIRAPGVLGDAVTTALVLRRTPADSVTATTDQTVRVASLRRTAADSAPATDAAVITLLRKVRALADTAPVSLDNAVRSLGIYKRGPPDSAPATDAVVRVFRPVRQVADAAPVSDDAIAHRRLVLLPDSILTQTNFTGTLADIKHPVDFADTTWMLGQRNVTSVLHVTMENPVGPLKAGAGDQIIRIRVRPMP